MGGPKKPGEQTGNAEPESGLRLFDKPPGPRLETQERERTLQTPCALWVLFFLMMWSVLGSSGKYLEAMVRVQLSPIP